MKILSIGFVFVGFLSSVLSLPAQVTRPQATPAQRPAGQAKPRYKAIWERVNYTEDLSLNSVYFVSAQTGWVSGGTGGGAGVILNTQDGGKHWGVQWGDPQGKDDAPANFFFLDATHGWVRQGYNDLLHTTDGQNWVAGAKIDHYNSDYVFTSEKNGVAISGGRAIYRTTDGGRIWNVVNQCSVRIQVDGLPRNVECNWDKIHFPTETTGYATAWIDHSDIAVVGKTRDGGATWTLTLTDVGVGYPSDVFFLDENIGFMRRGTPIRASLRRLLTAALPGTRVRRLKARSSGLWIRKSDGVSMGGNSALASMADNIGPHANSNSPSNQMPSACRRAIARTWWEIMA